MTATSEAPGGIEERTPDLILDIRLFRSKMSALGHRTDLERAAAVGMSRATLHRLGRGQSRIHLERALQIARLLNVELDELFHPVED